MYDVLITYGWWLLIAMLFGIAEGFFYDLKDPQKTVGKDSFILKFLYKASFGLYKKPNEHAILNLLRTGVALSLLPSIIWWQLGILLLCFVGSFPFIHDGFYYLTRNKLNGRIYRCGFLSENDPRDGDTSWSLGLRARTIAFAVSLIIVLLLEILR